MYIRMYGTRKEKIKPTNILIKGASTSVLFILPGVARALLSTIIQIKEKTPTTNQKLSSLANNKYKSMRNKSNYPLSALVLDDYYFTYMYL